MTTCNKDTKNLVQGTAVPQEVEKGKEIVFTYDVTFKVSCFKPFGSSIPSCNCGVNFNFLWLCSRKVISNGRLVGILICS